MHPDVKKHLDKSLLRVEAAFTSKHADLSNHEARKQKLLQRIKKNSEVLPAKAQPAFFDKAEEVFLKARADDFLGAAEAFADLCELAIKAIGPFPGANKTTP